MKVIFVTPPSKFLLNEYVYPSLGILYVAAAAQQAGYNCQVILPSVSQLNEQISGDIICVTGTTPHYESMVDIAKSNQGKRLIAGGPHASADPQSLLEAGYDTVVIGEGEEAIVEALSGKRGIIIGKRIKNLDSLPLPARDLIPMERYTYDLEGLRSTYIMANRGCHWKCGFCSKPWDQNTVTGRSVDSVVNEALLLRDKYGFQGVMFFDDIFTLNKAWLTEFCKKFKQTGMRWRCFLRADTASYEKLKMMKDAGCDEVGVGVESASNEILRVINKNETIEHNTKARQFCADIGIRFKSFFIIGLPGETYQTAEQTYHWILNNRPDAYSLFVFIPLPGAPIYEDVLNHSNKYDYTLEVQDYRHYYWGGIMSEQISPGRTKALSAEEIVRLRNDIAAALNTQGLTDLNNQMQDKNNTMVNFHPPKQ